MKNSTRKSKYLITTAVCAALSCTGAWAADSIGEPGRSSGKANPLNNVYFGEQHLHTANSPDAFAMGTRNTPDDAYRFATDKKKFSRFVTDTDLVRVLNVSDSERRLNG